jgi:AcrR family transcriptional regulator
MESKKRRNMTGKREQHKQQTRSAILEAAMRLFTEKGYERTSITDLAREAGIGKGTIYSYFRTKSEIFLAFCEEQLEAVRTAIVQTELSSMSLLDRLIAVYAADFRFIHRNPEFGRLLMRETFFPTDLNLEQSRRLDDRYIALLVPLLKKAQARGELRCDVELTLVLGHFYGIYNITVSAWFTRRLLSEEDVLMALHALFEQALQGLAPPPCEHESCRGA